MSEEGKPGTAGDRLRILACGDGAITVQLSEGIDEAVNRRVIALCQSLAQDPIAGIEETVPTYRSLMVAYDPAVIGGAALGARIERRLAGLSTDDGQGRLFTVPVLYEGEAALDLEDLAAMKAMTPQELVALHSSVEYRVYMIGFAPGFAYLGGLPDVLHTPRLTTPRQRIEAGSIGIGGRQASINSVTSPSGWRFIGRTPLRLFDPERPAPFLLRAGDRVRFRAIDPIEAAELDARTAAGESVVEPQAA